MQEHPTSITRSGRRRVFLALALGAAICLAASSCGSGHPPPGHGATTVPAATAPSASPPAASPAPTTARTGTWQIPPAAPVATWPVLTEAVWTGSQMIIHGILDAGGNGYQGVTFAYRPVTDTWATLASGPAPGWRKTATSPCGRARRCSSSG